jgi:putative PEP-CTERM system histidine kinase
VVSNTELISAWSYALVGISYLFILSKIRFIRLDTLKSDASKPLVILALIVTTIWGFLAFFNSIFQSATFRHLSILFDFFRYYFWCYFLIFILDYKKTGLKTFFKVSILIFLLMSVFSNLLLLFSDLFVKFTSFSNNLVPLSKLLRLVFSVYALVLIEQVFSSSEGDIKWKIKPMCIGLASIFVFDFYIFSEDILFNKLNSEASAVRGLIHALIVPLLFTTLADRSRNNFKFKLSRNSVFHSLALTLSGIYLILIAAIGYYIRFFGGEWGQVLQVSIVYLSLLIFTIILFSNNYRSKIKVYIGKNFFHYIFDYREEWLKFTNVLVDNDSKLEMNQQIIKGFSTMLDCSSGSLWIKNSNKDAFNQVAQFNQMHTHLVEDSQSSFCKFLSQTGWVINVEEYRNFPQIYQGMKIPAWVDSVPDTWLIIPLLVGDEMIGFCTLDTPRNPLTVNWEVNDLLKTAGRQAAGFLVQIQATEALLETRKFASFNRMSAFVVHDLKNIITQLSLMMKNSQRLLSNPEFQNDMLLTVENSLVRMRQLMLQLRNGTPLAMPTVAVDLGLVIRRIASSVTRSGRSIELKLLFDVLVLGQEDRIERIFGHLIQNALDATEGGGAVILSLDQVGSQAKFVISDTGKGMTHEFVSTRLFKPFQTTKQYGMGFGAYESYLYIQELGGRIDVSSEQGVGTTLTILIPLFQPFVSDVIQAVESA